MRGLLFYLSKHHNNYTMQRRHPMGKAFFTYEQQLYKLQSEKELTISDPSYALKTWAEKNELVDSVIESQDKQDLEDLLDKLSQEEVMLIMDVELFDFSDKDELIDFFQRHLSIRKLFIGDER